MRLTARGGDVKTSDPRSSVETELCYCLWRISGDFIFGGEYASKFGFVALDSLIGSIYFAFSRGT